MRAFIAIVAACLALAMPAVAAAFSGFFVSASGDRLYNDAAVVVLMRDGDHTVLSLQNHYDGPPEDFALIVPVPTAVEEGDIRVLSRDLFDRVDRLTAPRLVEYWEQDPCPRDDGLALGPDDDEASQPSPVTAESEPTAYEPRESREPTGVAVAARFSVGEYDFEVLDAEQSVGLERWLRRHGYQVPDGAEALLRPYVHAGMKFVVAKVDVRRLPAGRGALSPLRIHYRTDALSLPLRPGALNSRGAADLIVVILARGVRYEAANYPNFAVPTNLDVAANTGDAFGPFYAALFDRMVDLHPDAALTEYAWDAASCDPCPVPPLSADEVATLGGDVIPSYGEDVARGEVPLSFVGDFVVTRLHLRTTGGYLPRDLDLRPAPPIRGGVGIPGPAGELDKGVAVASQNYFQGRFVMRHPHEGDVACDDPRRGVWGGPQGTDYYASLGPIQSAAGSAFALRGDFELAAYLSREVPMLGDPGAAQELPTGPVTPPPVRRPRGGCGACAVPGLPGPRASGARPNVAFLGILAISGFMGLLRARRRRRRG
ncbi:MAG: DUF2330 domain-containing protein [Deltaproteobacteria bacterium]|nr:DUF2330 domain-containing protein [Deltaproteobacteria bacterium]